VVNIFAIPLCEVLPFFLVDRYGSPPLSPVMSQSVLESVGSALGRLRFFVSPQQSS